MRHGNTSFILIVTRLFKASTIAGGQSPGPHAPSETSNIFTKERFWKPQVPYHLALSPKVGQTPVNTFLTPYTQSCFPTEHIRKASFHHVLIPLYDSAPHLKVEPKPDALSEHRKRSVAWSGLIPMLSHFW